ncbi:zinc finger, CCHC-type containing protein [Tanacetum coccineum]
MTTSVGNNSVFRSFFEKQKLTGPNFIDWYRQLRLVLSTEDKEYYLEHPIPAAPVAQPGEQIPPEDLAAHAAWVKGQKEVAVLMLLTMDLDIQRNLAHLGRRKVNPLHEESLPKKDANPALHAIRAGRVQKNQKNKPHKAGRGGKGKGKNKMGYAHNNVPFAPKPKTSPPPKKDNPAKDAICHQCGEVGHWRRNCPVYLTELMKKKKLSQGASTSGALSLYVGDGHRAAVEAIGTYHLELPSGLVIVLNNCHYAPSITRGVISVSRLFDDGFINRFDDNNVISVSKNNLVYFMAVPRDGIFEIDMSCSNTNDSSMEHGIMPIRSHSLQPQNNGSVREEKSNTARHGSFMMSQTTLPKSFWDYALESAARILNMVPSKKVDKTPYEIWLRASPKLVLL